MDVRHLIFVLLFYLAFGFFASMGVLKPQRMGNRYYLYHGLGTAVLTLGSWAVLGDHPAIPYVERALLFFAVFCAGYSVFRGRRWWAAIFFYIMGFFSGLYVIVADLVRVFSDGSPSFPDLIYFLSNGLLSTLLLGFTMGAMLVGHWYLVQPKLSIDELKRTTRIFVGLVLIRFVLGTAAIGTVLWGMDEAAIYRYLFAGYPGLFVVMRWAWGLLAPLVLCYFVWGTVRIRSTQSATGILYVAVICVLAGETLSQYLTYFHGLPI